MGTAKGAARVRIVHLIDVMSWQADFSVVHKNRMRACT